MASEADWENTEEGERPDLCWEDPANCPLGADVEPQQFYARALLPVVEQEIAAARAEERERIADLIVYDLARNGDFMTPSERKGQRRAARIARTAAQTATSTEEER
ncbi:MAG TPA: hypothetical protein VFH56_11055 [Acidimicrobiales bacterium]|nr:hypothetical protein [Acidimicrobiales bacterium]